MHWHLSEVFDSSWDAPYAQNWALFRVLDPSLRAPNAQSCFLMPFDMPWNVNNIPADAWYVIHRGNQGSDLQ